jgi:hypothetical protein
MKALYTLLFFVFITTHGVMAQCSMCTKTAADLNAKAAEDINSAIIYLAFIPLLLIGGIGFIWWKHYRKGNAVG